MRESMYPNCFFLNTYLETVFFPPSSFIIVGLANIEPSGTKVYQGLLIYLWNLWAFEDDGRGNGRRSRPWELKSFVSNVTS